MDQRQSGAVTVPGGVRLTYSVRECAELLGVSTDLVYELAAARVIPATKVGRRLLISGKGLQDFLEQRFGGEVAVVNLSQSSVQEHGEADTDRISDAKPEPDQTKSTLTDLLDRLVRVNDPPLSPPPSVALPPPPSTVPQSGHQGRPDPLLSLEDVSEWLGVSPRTLYNWRHRGGGPPALRIGRHLRYRREDVQAWVDNQD